MLDTPMDHGREEASDRLRVRAPQFKAEAVAQGTSKTVENELQGAGIEGSRNAANDGCTATPYTPSTSLNPTP